MWSSGLFGGRPESFASGEFSRQVRAVTTVAGRTLFLSRGAIGRARPTRPDPNLSMDTYPVAWMEGSEKSANFELKSRSLSDWEHLGSF